MSKNDTTVIKGAFGAKSDNPTARQVAMAYANNANDDDEIILIVKRKLDGGAAVGFQDNVGDFTTALGMVELVKFAMIESSTDPGEGGG